MRRLGIIVLVLCFTCVSPHPAVVELSNKLPVGMLASTSWNTSSPLLSELQPPKISESEFPTPPLYHIRTRVVIEKVSVPPVDGIDGVEIFAATEKNVNEELKLTELIFWRAKLRFSVESITFVEYRESWGEYVLDSIRYPEYLSIYFMLPNSFELNGVASSPWDLFPSGVLLSATRSETTLAHEIGHYFGLLHTFDEDYCKDTVPQEKYCRDSKKYKKNCCNVMNYCVHPRVLVTTNQINRMLAYLRTGRRNHVIENPLSDSDRLALLSRHLLDINSRLAAITSQPTSKPVP